MDDRPSAQMALERSVVEGGRAYRITARTLDDGRTALTVQCGPAGAAELNEISGVVAAQDLPVLARVLRPELTSIAAWHGIDLDPADWREQIRKQHPNAYMPWTAEQEEALIDLYESGVAVREIAKQIGRRTGAVMARLEKLGVTDKRG